MHSIVFRMLSVSLLALNRTKFA